MPRHQFDGGGRPLPRPRTPYDRPPEKSYYVQSERRERLPSSWNTHKRNAIGHSAQHENDGATFENAYQEPPRDNHHMEGTYGRQLHPHNAITQSDQYSYRHEGMSRQPHFEDSVPHDSVGSAGVAAMRALVQSHDENERLAAENEHLRQQLSDMHQQLHHMPSENEDLRWKLSEFRQRVFDLQDEKEDMRRQLSASCQRVRELESQLHQGQSTLRNDPRRRGTQSEQSQPRNDTAQAGNAQDQLKTPANKPAELIPASKVEQHLKGRLRDGKCLPRNRQKR